MKRGSAIVELAARFGLVASLVVTVLLVHAIWQKRCGVKLPAFGEPVELTNAPPVIEEPMLPMAVVATNSADPFCGFRWADAYSTNFVTYASNLVALGCPLRTVHAALRAGMLRQQEAEIEALSNPPFWADYETRSRMELEKVLLQEQIRDGYSLLLWQLTGEHLRPFREPTNLDEALLAYTIVSVFVGPIEREKRIMLLELIAKVEELDNNRVPAAFEGEWKRQHGQQFAKDVQSLLTPAEMDSFLAHLLCFTGDEGVAAMAGSPGELQQITTTLAASMRPKFLEMLEKGLDNDDTEKFFESALLNNLPAPKKWTLLQVEDSGFREFSEPLAATPARGGVLEAVWEANSLLTEIEMDPGLDVSEKLRGLEQGRMATAAAVLGLVGEAEFARVWPAINRWLGTRQNL